MATPSMPIPKGIEGALDTTIPAPPRSQYLETIHDWVTTTDHKKIGILYICFALFFLLSPVWKRW